MKRVYRKGALRMICAKPLREGSPKRDVLRTKSCAITGHKTLKEVTRYTAAYDRKRAGKSAIEKITTRTSSGKPQ